MKIGVIFFLLFLSPPLVYSQLPVKNGQEHAVFNSFHGALGELTSRFGNKTDSGGYQPDIAELLDKITEHVKFLESVITSGKPIPKEYLESVSLDGELLKRLARKESKSEPERKRLYEGLKEVESDLALKITGKRGSSEVARVVQLLVHAKRGDQDVGAYEVWYVPRGWASDSSAFKRFDGLTNPSNPPSMNLAPGNYFVWLSKGQPVTERQPVSIGVNGEAKREIDVVVP